jgi:hypothetical protein
MPWPVLNSEPVQRIRSAPLRAPLSRKAFGHGAREQLVCR